MSGRSARYVAQMFKPLSERSLQRHAKSHLPKPAVALTTQAELVPAIKSNDHPLPEKLELSNLVKGQFNKMLEAQEQAEQRGDPRAVITAADMVLKHSERLLTMASREHSAQRADRRLGIILKSLMKDAENDEALRISLSRSLAKAEAALLDTDFENNA